MAPISFEDRYLRPLRKPLGIRRICRVLENAVALDTLITQLAKQGVITPLEVKPARFAAGLRTSAAHARWKEIKLGDVDPVIQFTRELMSAHLV